MPLMRLIRSQRTTRSRLAHHGWPPEGFDKLGRSFAPRRKTRGIAAILLSFALHLILLSPLLLELNSRKSQSNDIALGSSKFSNINLHQVTLHEVTLHEVALHDSDLQTTESTTQKNKTALGTKLKDTAATPAAKKVADAEADTDASTDAETENRAAIDPLAGRSQPKGMIGESDLESSLSGRAPSNEKERYLAQIRDQIAKEQTYPAPSRAFREEGTVRVLLTLDRNGSIVKLELITASPHKRLNDAAMRAATRAAPFRPFPDEVQFETWKISLPVRFALAGRSIH